MMRAAWRKFCEGVAEGLSGAEAYRRAYPRGGAKWAGSEAAKLRKRPEVAAELARLQELAAATAGPAAISLAEKRRFLARIIRAEVANLPEHSDLWQSIKRTRDSVEFRLPDKLAALKADHELAGEAGEEKRDALDEWLDHIRDQPWAAEPGAGATPQDEAAN